MCTDWIASGAEPALSPADGPPAMTRLSARPTAPSPRCLWPSLSPDRPLPQPVPCRTLPPYPLQFCSTVAGYACRSFMGLEPDPRLLSILHASDPAVREEAWAALIREYSPLLLHVARTLGGDRDV